MMGRVTSSDYFDQLYAGTDDPWGLTSRWYEQRKYALTLAALPNRSYARGFEPGCAMGVLTAGLAKRCDRLVAWDIAARAVEQARSRVPDAHVDIAAAAIPDRWPDGAFDLVVLSEVLYFLAVPDRGRVYQRLVAHSQRGGGQPDGGLTSGGHLVAVHWRHGFAEAPSNGDEVHAELAALPGLHSMVSHVEPDFRLDVWSVG